MCISTCFVRARACCLAQRSFAASRRCVETGTDAPRCCACPQINMSPPRPARRRRLLFSDRHRRRRRRRNRLVRGTRRTPTRTQTITTLAHIMSTPLCTHLRTRTGAHDGFTRGMRTYSIPRIFDRQFGRDSIRFGHTIALTLQDHTHSSVMWGKNQICPPRMA